MVVATVLLANRWYGMVYEAMDETEPLQLKTKDFVAVQDQGQWHIAPVRLMRAAAYVLAAQSHEPGAHEHEPPRVRLGHEDAASVWLSHEPAQGLLKQFWSHERRRFEAADEDEAYALLIHIQRTFSNKALN